MSKNKYNVHHDIMYDVLSNYISDRLKEKIKGNVYVTYSNFDEDKKGIPINNIDEIAVKGKIRFYQKHDPFWGKGKDYTSKPIKNPTWLSVAKLANDMIKTTGDTHHRFLEGIYKRKNKYYFKMGS